MIAGGQETKCYRIVHGAGREPIEVARPCTSGEKKARERKGPTQSPAKTTDEARDAQQKLKSLESGWAKFSDGMAACERKFSRTACNR